MGSNTHTHQRTQLMIVTNIIEREFVATAVLSLNNIYSPAKLPRTSAWLCLLFSFFFACHTPFSKWTESTTPYMSNVARIMHAWCSFAPCRLSFDTRNHATHRFSTGTTLYILIILLLTINTRVSSVTGIRFFVFFLPNFELCILFTLRVLALYSRARPRIRSRETVSAIPSRVSFFCTVREIGSTRVRAIRSRAARLCSRARLRIWSRETVSAVPSRVSFFLYRPRSDRHGYERSGHGPHGFILVRA